jgi:hypothetical protein
MNKIDKDMKIFKHITLEIKVVVTIYVISIPFKKIQWNTMKSHTNTSRSWEILINEWITSNSGIMAFNPNNVFTLTNRHKLDLAKVMVGASNAIFVRKVQYSHNTCLIKLVMDIHLVFMFHKILLSPWSP